MDELSYFRRIQGLEIQALNDKNQNLSLPTPPCQKPDYTQVNSADYYNTRQLQGIITQNMGMLGSMPNLAGSNPFAQFLGGLFSPTRPQEGGFNPNGSTSQSQLMGAGSPLNFRKGGNYSPPERDPFPFIIVNRLTGTRIVMKVLPEDISDSSAAQFNQQVPLGRSVPIWGYASSGPRNISFQVTLHDDMCEDGLLKTVYNCYALQYPKYEGNQIKPPKAIITIGNIIRISAVPQSVSVSWRKPVRDNIYISAEVSFSFASAEEIPFGSDDIESLGTNPDHQPGAGLGSSPTSPAAMAGASAMNQAMTTAQTAQDSLIDTLSINPMGEVAVYSPPYPGVGAPPFRG